MENITDINLWEEKNLIVTKKNCLSNTEIEQKNIILNIEKELGKKECKDIGKKRWKKICPNCGAEAFYSSKQHMERSIRENRSCLKCGSFKNSKYIEMKYGSLTIIKQYNGVSPCGSRIIKVDYKCDCGYVGINKRIECVKRQKMCLLCKKQNRFKIIDPGKSAFNNLYYGYMKSAEKRLYSFQLTKTEFELLTKQNCFYCGSSPNNKQIARKNKEYYIYNGIDRVDNSKGYTLDNSVSCCKLCNFFKMKLSVDEFLGHIKKIYGYRFVENKRQ